MKFEEHCQESIKLFGSPWPEVHTWLDEFAGQEPYGMNLIRFPGTVSITSG